MPSVPSVGDGTVEVSRVIHGKPSRALLEVILQEMLGRPITEACEVYSEVGIDIIDRGCDIAICAAVAGPASAGSIVAGSVLAGRTGEQVRTVAVGARISEAGKLALFGSAIEVESSIASTDIIGSTCSMSIASAVDLAVRACLSSEAGASLRSNALASIATVAAADRNGAIVASIASIAGALEVSVDSIDAAQSASSLVEGAKVAAVHIINVLSDCAVSSAVTCIAVALSIDTDAIVAIGTASLIGLH